MLILNIDALNNSIRVKREHNNVVGSSYTGTSLITALNRVIQFNVGLNTDFITNRNTRTYFDPSETLSLGSTAGVGIGSTIRYTLGVVGGGSTDKFVLTQQALIPGHGFRNGKKLLYNNGEGTSIQVYNGISTFNLANNSIVYVINDGRDLIGLSTNPVNWQYWSSCWCWFYDYRLFFTGHGSGRVHSLLEQDVEVTGV